MVGGGGYPKGAGTELIAPLNGVFELGGNIPAARSEAINGFSPPAGTGAGVVGGCDEGSGVGGNGT